jgi:hypothetical protein
LAQNEIPTSSIRTSRAWLPDFSWYKIPKNIPNYHELYQMSI